MVLNGAHILIECLKEQGVDTVFGFPGGAVIPLYDALYQHRDAIKHHRTCHEQAAIHAADGYARATGRVGVGIVTSGPGATNTITGIATAFMDSMPLVVICGQVANPLIGRDAFQEVDITSMTLTITKHCEMVRSLEDLPEAMMRAFDIARSGRPGPVLIDVPKNIFLEEMAFDVATLQSKAKASEANPCITDHPMVLAIRRSKKPVIIAGGGVRHAEASDALFAFATQFQIPVANTLMGSGTFPQDHPLALGMIGMHGHAHANRLLSGADLVITMGVRFSDRVIGRAETFCKNAVMIQMDIDRNEFNKNITADHHLMGDLKDYIQQLTPLLAGWGGYLCYSPKEKEAAVQAPTFTAKHILKTIKEAVGSEAIVVTEVGQHQMWTAQHWGFNAPRQFLTSGGLGTMGFGLGAAIGAQIGCPHETVVHIAGDGSFKMNAIELSTVSKYKLPILTVIFNNQSLGMVRQWQKMFCDSRFSETDGDDSVDFVKLAAAFGITGIRVSSIEALKLMLSAAFDRTQPLVIECLIHQDDAVYPIVPPGCSLTEMDEGGSH